MDGTVLIADDDKSIRTVLTQAMTRAGCKVHATSSLGTLKRWVSEGMGDVVITDVIMGDENGLDALPDIKAMRPDLPVIVISAQNTIMTALQAEEAEAWDYLPKPFDLTELLRRTSQAIESKPAAASGPTDGSELPLIGQSAPMQGLYRKIAKVVNAPLPVLITGEGGSGKSLVARLLHDLSSRTDSALVSVDADDLNSTDRAAEALQKARNGTLVIDDVEDLGPEAQARLSRMIDSNKSARIIATTSLGSQETLREDLLYRLAGVTLHVPALRDRTEDIALHVGNILGDTHELSEGALAQMRRYSWPGNVRQLIHVIHGLSLTAAQPVISEAEARDALAAQPSEAQVAKGQSLQASIAEHLTTYFNAHGGELPPDGLYTRILHEMETPLIEIALTACGGNQAKCATLLGINRNTLRKKILELGIEVTRRRKMM